MEKLTKENYYDSDRVSNSSLSWLLPETGGSLTKFIYKSGIVEHEESESMRLGTLIHKFVEKGYDADIDKIFEVAEIPSPAIAKIIQEVSKNPSAPLRDEILRVARANEYQSTWKDDTVVNKILAEGSAYLEKLKLEETGKVLVSNQEMNQLHHICARIKEVLTWNFYKEGFLGEVIMTPAHGEPGDDVEILNECAIAFEYNDIECKSLIDILLVNHTRKTISIVDLKTTNIPNSIYTGYTTDDIDQVTGELVEKWVEGVMYKRQVHRQMAFYKLAASAQYPDYTFNKAYVFAVETIAPYDVKLIAIPEKYMELGLRRINFAMPHFKYLPQESNDYDI